ncbi:MAG: extracellular solute-binding protein [Defluviitaleaceae bacterium]|nr:extracellular solute-binding protein [Defluviitaleaceae bacterium]
MRKMTTVLLLVIVLTLGLFVVTACSGTEDEPAATPAAEATPTPAADATTPDDTTPPDETPADGPGTWPVAGNPTVTWWTDLNSGVSANYTHLGETPHAQALMEITGVNIEFIHPPMGQGTEQFNLMMATRDFPDLIEINWLTTYQGGPDRAIEEGVILRLNEVFEAYAPNVLNVLEVERPDLGRLARTDSGNYFVFPFLRGHRANQVFTGPFMRADWLYDLGLDVPETLEDWEEALILFRDEKGAIAPFTYQWGQRWLCPIAAAFDIRVGNHFFVNDAGEVAFGYTEDAFLDYMILMNRWFEEGLLDPDFGNVPADMFNTRLTTGQSGAAMGNIGAAIGVLMNAMSDDPVYDLVPLPVPVQVRGQQPRFGHMESAFLGGHSVAITTAVGNLEAAARLLDFGYSPEGYLFFNFGVEGESFNMVDGIPTFTEIVTAHPDGWPLNQAIASVARSSYGGPMVQSYHYVWQFFQLQRQRDALEMWLTADSERFFMPPVTPTATEADRLAAILPDLHTFVEEMHMRFIFGDEALTQENFNNFRNTLNALGLEEAMEIQTAALARFHQR